MQVDASQVGSIRVPLCAVLAMWAEVVPIKPLDSTSSLGSPLHRLTVLFQGRVEMGLFRK